MSGQLPDLGLYQNWFLFYLGPQPRCRTVLVQQQQILKSTEELAQCKLSMNYIPVFTMSSIHYPASDLLTAPETSPGVYWRMSVPGNKGCGRDFCHFLKCATTSQPIPQEFAGSVPRDSSCIRPIAVKSALPPHRHIFWRLMRYETDRQHFCR